MLFVFFFKQKTAYELRISDWSSDVCSSDLNFGRDVVVDGNNRLGVDHSMRRETRNTEMMFDVLAGAPQSMRATEQTAVVVGSATHRARHPAVSGASRTFTAPWKKSHHDAGAHRQRINSVAEFDDSTCRLMAQQHRHGSYPIAVDHGEVGVT